MLRHKNYLQGIFVILATILFITACGSKKTSTQPPVKTVTLALTNTGTVQPVTSPSVSPSLTMTVQPTASPSASPSPTMTASPTQTSSATSTPNLTPPAPTKTVIVTLDASHKSELTLELLENNSGCQLPCWWGIMPGETSWEEALAFLAQFDSKIFKSTTDDERFAEAIIPPQSNPKGDIGKIDITIYTPKSADIIEKIIVYIPNEAPLTYTAGNFLDIYGKPGDILLKTFASYPGGIPFETGFFYPDKGYFAVYSQSDPIELRNPMIRGCLDGSPDLYLTTPQKGMSFPDFAQLFAMDIPEGEPFRSISEVTNMTVDTFYLKFKGDQQAPCVDTPEKFWPVIP